jgi:hypothetical protein
MSNRYRRYSKRELLGSLYVDYVMSVTDLGLTPKANRWDVLRAFLDVGEARAERLVEETGGFLVLQSVPGRPNTGGIYAYIERLQAFFWLRFEQKEDTLNGEDFQQALRIHHLVRFVSGHPSGAHRRHRRNRKARPTAKGSRCHSASGFGGSGCLTCGRSLAKSAGSGSFDRVSEPGYNYTTLEEGRRNHVVIGHFSVETTSPARGTLASDC